MVKDIERAVKFYSSVGIGPFVTPEKVLHDNSGYTFFDTEEHAGVVLEIRQDPLDDK